MMSHRFFFFFFAVIGAQALSAQCIALQNCPNSQDTVTVCATNADQPTLWSHLLFYNSVTESTNLFEGEPTLSANAVYTPNCGTPIDTRFELYLDLNGDGTPESVVQSWALPPAGALLYNNIADPQNSGTLVSFDNRPVALNQKYQFAAEIITGPGALSATLKFTTAAMGGSYIAPLLPNGKHTIKWTFTSSTGESVSCIQPFNIKDCTPPNVACNTGLLVNLISSTPPSVTLWATDVLAGAMDNISTSSSMEVLIREFGTGAPYSESLTFDCNDLGTTVVQLRIEDQSGNTNSCWGEIILEDILNVCAGASNNEFSFCLRRWCDGALIAGVNSLKLGGITISNPDNCSTAYPAPPTGGYTASLEKTGDMLNGVTVLDAWKTVGHILGIQQFTTPFELLAADVNQSNSVTTFDVVQLLRAISGLPNSITRPSWTVLDSVSLTGTWTSPNNGGSHLNTPFIAVKTGDLDCDGAPGLQQSTVETRATARLTLPNQVLTPGEIVEVPLKWELPGDWLCFQFGLLYDTTKLQLLGAESPLTNNYGTVNSAINGEVNMAWLDLQSVFFQPSDTLMMLRFKALATQPLLDALELYATTGPIQGTPSIGYNLQQEAIDLVLAGVSNTSETADPSLLRANVVPNPSSAAADLSLKLWSPVPSQGVLELLDSKGTLYYKLPFELRAGEQFISIPSEAFSATTGLYFWTVKTTQGTYSGKISRM
jgi:hypothetical protein